jgi:glycyl-tRNA synthetase
VDEIALDLMDSDLATRVDKSSAALGRRYARTDELGVPFAITVDFQTLADGTVTMRERDSMVQVRLPKEDVTMLIHKIVHKKMDWKKVTTQYPVVQVDEGDGSPSGVKVESSAATKVETSTRGRFSRPV